jgi:peptidoglycan/LPS O-acetylase OafA/YrhL
MKYRADVDGLRALAVIAVVGFHAFPRLVPGGFVGVDVFFVISGYLISSIIIAGLQDGRFTFSGFYARRIRRIFPALIVVLGACYAAGWFLLFADAFMQLGKHIAAGAGFVANFVLAREAGYFDNVAETKPLMHLWSLGIEEQFYLVWPLAAFLVWKGRLNLLIFTGVVLTLSMASNLETIRRDLVGGFYSPTTRFWELMAGTILACLEIDASRISRRLGDELARLRASPVWRDAAAALGLVLIAAAVFGLDRTRHFPGAWAVLPVGGAWLSMAAGAEASLNRLVLSRRTLVWIGLISYPLYLWHWPLLSFARLLMNETPPPAVRGGAIVLSVLLAWLTYRLIESPIRFGPRRALVVPALCLALGGLLWAGYFTFQQDGLLGRAINRTDEGFFVEYYTSMKKKGIADAYRRECDFMEWGTDAARPSIAAECTTPGSRGTYLLWGDSFAQALSFGLRDIMPAGVNLAQVATSHCRPSIVPIDLDVPGERCSRANAFALESISRLKPDVLVLSQMGGHQDTDWPALAARARALGAKDVVLVGPLPRWEPSLPDVVVSRYWGRSFDRIGYGVPPVIFDLDRELAARFAGSPVLRYVSVLDSLCNSDGCIATVPGSNPPELVAFDFGHLTPRGSRFVAEAALRPALVRP